MADWFFTSDLHGQSELYEQVVAQAAAGKPRVLILGGDLGPHAVGAGGIRRQRLFLEGFLVEFARRIREVAPGTELLLMMGNDDWAANLDVLDQHDGALWRQLHGRCVIVDDVRVAGLSWVPITPFANKDWERWDDEGGDPPARLQGWRSAGAGVEAFQFDPARHGPTLTGALLALAAESPPAGTLYVFHSPPWNTACDLTYQQVHVGARAIRAFVERWQPPLVLSGHIHESPRVSGRWRDTVGVTVCVNPGQFGTTRLCGVWFDPRRAAATLRHTAHEAAADAAGEGR